MSIADTKIEKSKSQVREFLTGVLFGLLVVSTLTALSLFTMGCSNQTRTSTPQVTEAELMTIYTAISQNTDSMLDANLVSALDASGTTEMFFVENDSARPPESILAADDLGFLNTAWSGMNSNEVGLQTVQVFFLDGYATGANLTDPRSFVLKIAITDDQGATTYYAAQSSDGSYDFTKTEFTVTLTPSNGGPSIMLYSTDLNPNYQSELNGTAKFQIYDAATGDFIGQISAMHLYSAN